MRGIRFLFLLQLFASVTALAAPPAKPDTPAKTYKLTTISVVRTAPDGGIADVWSDGTLFTAHADGDHWLRVSGTFPDGKWQPLPHPFWVLDYYAQDLAKRRAHSVHPGEKRLIVVDKSRFLLKVIQNNDSGKKVLYKTKVALGMDGCKPQSKGGRCYYTEPGDYAVRWKIHDPKGIEWCIPNSMTQEYPDDVREGKRCFRGPLGRYALNIGKSYAIHGTDRPDLLGKRVSHGCIRVANSAMRVIYKLMDVGDPVKIIQ